jgi:hypothetical protein
MKILTYKVPVKLKRVDGEVELTAFDEDKVLLDNLTERVKLDSGTMIPSVAKDIADKNNTERTMKKATLMDHEDEGEGFINYKVLVE